MDGKEAWPAGKTHLTGGRPAGKFAVMEFTVCNLPLTLPPAMAHLPLMEVLLPLNLSLGKPLMVDTLPFMVTKTLLLMVVTSPLKVLSRLVWGHGGSNAGRKAATGGKLTVFRVGVPLFETAAVFAGWNSGKASALSDFKSFCFYCGFYNYKGVDEVTPT